MQMLQFSSVAATPQNPHWTLLTERLSPLYRRAEDIRDPFTRDYTRMLHANAYRRLKHKTQVFYNTDNDHICTRMEHVCHVESVSSSIARALGLNEALTRAISIGHDLGHAPFGHQGEKVLCRLSRQYLQKDFWHEQNGLRFVDEIELLEDASRYHRNLDLTYAVRDGILSHCGEVDENGLRPRDIQIPLTDFCSPGQLQAVTWEGCVVKMADKIAYLGRDIEDAISLGVLSPADQQELAALAGEFAPAFPENAPADSFPAGNPTAGSPPAVNTTVIMHSMITDICQHSSPKQGICLSAPYFALLNRIKAFNYDHIYQNRRLQPYVCYAELVLQQLFGFLLGLYRAGDFWREIRENQPYAPTLLSTFAGWLARYTQPEALPEPLRPLAGRCLNRKIYDRLQTEQLYLQAVLDYLSGMTDRFAVTVFHELLTFGQPLPLGDAAPFGG